MIDCHWHPTAYKKKKIKKEITKANEVGVKKFIGVPLDYPSNEKLLKISKDLDSIFPAVGLHPRYAVNSSEEDIEKVLSSLGNPRVIATGEIGVDLHFLDKNTKDTQLNVFVKILNKAVEEELPVILHCPKGEPITYREVKKTKAEKSDIPLVY